MSRFYFRLSNGTLAFQDREGTELTGLAEVQSELLAFGRDILRHRFTYGIDDPSEWAISVVNEIGRVLASMPLKNVRRTRRAA